MGVLLSVWISNLYEMNAQMQPKWGLKLIFEKNNNIVGTFIA